MKIKCPACSKVLNIPDTAAGKVVKCPCGKQLRAPVAKAGAPAAASAQRPAKPTQRPAKPTQRPAKPAQRPAAPAARPSKPAPLPSMKPTSGGGFSDAGFFDELTETDLQGVKAVRQPGLSESKAPANSKLLQQYGMSNSGDDGLSGPRFSGDLASPGTRILAALIDGAMIFTFAAIGFGLSVALVAITHDPNRGEPSPTVMMIVNILIFGGLFLGHLVNMVLISKSGQSVGKKVMKIQIVNNETGKVAGFFDGVLLRIFLFGFYTGLPCIGSFVALADIVYLFLDGHETVHDKVAHTAVIHLR